MAIPINKYIDIQTKVVNDVFGDRDWSGLVFTTTTMKNGAGKKTDYETNLKVVSLTKDEVADSFEDSSFLAFCNQYFAYNGGTKRPTHLNIAYVPTVESVTETALDAYNRVTGGSATVDAFGNFGSFCFYDSTFAASGEEGLAAVATANESNAYGWVMIAKTNATNQSADATAYGAKQLVHLTHDAVDAMAWYASVDYDQAGAAGTIDYKQFSGATATVKTASDKTTADGLKVNYIGQVQAYGNNLAFYQTGVNLDGTDLGVVRDMCWINSEITKAYFNLQTSAQKIPANYVGCAMVRNIIVDAATRGINNGAILLEKALTSDQISLINQYAGNTTAADEVSAAGYYIKANIVKDGSVYKCQYTLIYAKGDHIAKVGGVHVLV